MRLRSLEVQEFHQSPLVSDQEPHGTPIIVGRTLGQRLEFSDVRGPIHQRLLDELRPRECSQFGHPTAHDPFDLGRTAADTQAHRNRLQHPRGLRLNVGDGRKLGSLFGKFILFGEKPIHA